MKIKDVRVTVHRFDNFIPLIHKQLEGDYRVICRIETDEGHVGIGMASRFLWNGVAAIITHHLAPAILDMDPRDLEAIHARLQPIVSERGMMSGINLSAVSAVDLALWDIIGKASGRTVAQLLGGHKDYADAYVTYGFAAYDIDQLIEMGRQLIAKGHSRLKMLVGSKDGIKADAARVKAVREALGEDILLAIDANESLGAGRRHAALPDDRGIRHRLVRGSAAPRRRPRHGHAAQAHHAFRSPPARWTATRRASANG